MFLTDIFYEKKVRCPMCENSYGTKKVLSKAIKISSVDSDFYTVYEGPNPNHYLINVCPACGYSFLDKTEPKLTKRQKNLYQEQIASRWGRRDLTGGRSVQEALVAVKLAIFCAQYVEEPSRTVGGLCLQAAWLYRETGDGAEEERFLREAIEFYVHAYETDSKIEDSGRLPYLIGEMYRRLGHRNEAVSYYNRVISDKNASPKFVRKAREQWALSAEEHRRSG